MEGCVAREPCGGGGAVAGDESTVKGVANGPTRSPPCATCADCSDDDDDDDDDADKSRTHARTTVFGCARCSRSGTDGRWANGDDVEEEEEDDNDGAGGCVV